MDDTVHKSRSNGAIRPDILQSYRQLGATFHPIKESSRWCVLLEPSIELTVLVFKVRSDVSGGDSFRENGTRKSLPRSEKRTASQQLPFSWKRRPLSAGSVDKQRRLIPLGRMICSSLTRTQPSECCPSRNEQERSTSILLSGRCSASGTPTIKRLGFFPNKAVEPGSHDGHFSPARKKKVHTNALDLLTEDKRGASRP